MESRKLPFLQSQILDHIYLSIYKNKNLSIENISELTGYPTRSKILSNAINSLVKKEFLEEKDKFIFSVPENRQTFLKKE
ncbi:hypothetical protein GF312_20555 [Candidatus Poribacteria bacterium]|nr:hypothetical protein [Candidatus Poribacteria bacterium]